MGRGPRSFDEAGQGGFIVTMLALLITALVVAILLTADFGGSNAKSKAVGLQGSPLVSPAADIAAKEALSSVLASATQAVTAAGAEQGAVAMSTLTGANPDLRVVSGPSDGPTVVSATVSPPSAASLVPAGASDGGAVTLAVRSDSATCWFAWTDGMSSWYGAELNQSSCQAPDLPTPPVPGAVTASTVGWQPGSYPAA